MRRLFTLIAALAVLASIGTAAAAEAVRVAVAANFRGALLKLADDFRAETGHSIDISSGATGLLFAQITQGAPFDLFLAADLQRPRDLIASGLAVDGTLRTYASGQLVVLVRPEVAADVQSVRQVAALDRIAIANPRTAPYGRAAEQAIAARDLDLTGRLAFMQNVTGVIAAVRSGAAQAGFAARSALTAADGLAWRPVPSHLHGAIDQGAVLLDRARDNIAARSFLDYLASEQARNTIREFGYDVD